MLRTVCLASIAVIVVMLIAPPSGCAQGTVAAGYSSLREMNGVTYKKGWLASVATTSSIGIGVAGEIGANSRAPAGVSQQLLAVLGGVRFTSTASATYVPFVQVVAGLERFTEIAFTENGVAVQTGGGIDYVLADPFVVRGQGDYRWVRAGTRRFHEVRVSVQFGVRWQ